METCQTSNCDNSPIAIRLHCQEYLCVDHLLYHNEKLICEANIYCDEFNQLSEQIESMSFDEQFITAEEDLNEWLNDQMKELDKIYEEKLHKIQQIHNEVKEKVEKFKEIQSIKIIDIRRLFNSKLNKQISSEQLNQMKLTVEQLREDIEKFQTNYCSIKFVNNNQMNYSYKPNIEIRLEKNISQENQDCNKSKQSQLSANAKPFEYIPKEQTWNLISPMQQKNFSGRLFDEYSFMGSLNKTI